MRKILSLLLFAITILNLNGQTIGNSSNGTTTDPMGANYIIAARHLCPTNMTISNIVAKVVGIAGNYKAAVYRDSAGVLGQFLRGSQVRSTPTSGWYSFPLTSSLSLTNNSYYWLAIWSDNDNAAGFYTSTGNMLWAGPFAFSGSWPSSISTYGTFSLNYCIYATNMVIVPPVITNVSRNVTLAWDVSPSPNVTGYKLYWGGISRSYTNNINVGNVSIYTVTNLTVSNTYYFAVTAYDTSLESAFSDEISYTVPSTNLPPYVNVGSNKTITLPNSLALSAVVTDDGLPNNTLSFNWSVISGGSATFSSPQSTNSTVTFVSSGLYVLRLTVNDGASSSFDELNVTVISPNTAPTVNAGPDFNVSVNAITNLNGSITDDGLPNNVLITTWSVTSGPGTVSFGNVNSVNSPAIFPAVGSYILSLTGSDGLLNSTDSVTVNVLPVNIAPVASAGYDRYVTTNKSVLVGTATDDGLPSAALTYIWSQISGPTPISFTNATTPNTYVNLATPGTYVFRLQVSDSLLSSTDNVQVIYITPPIYFNDVLAP